MNNLSLCYDRTNLRNKQSWTHALFVYSLVVKELTIRNQNTVVATAKSVLVVHECCCTASQICASVCSPLPYPTHHSHIMAIPKSAFIARQQHRVKYIFKSRFILPFPFCTEQFFLAWDLKYIKTVKIASKKDTCTFLINITILFVTFKIKTQLSDKSQKQMS